MSDLIKTLRENRIRAYEASPGDIREHFGIEEVVLAGGYGYRQILELVQNGADAILEARETDSSVADPARIEIRLTENHLIAANTGAPFGIEGVKALLSSHSSPKRGNQIGRFGLGFKSLLRLGGKIDIVSGPFSFGFDPERCRSELTERFDCKAAPGLRLAWELTPEHSSSLRQSFPWATTVISADINSRDFLSSLRHELDNFPAEFLIFLPVSIQLAMDVRVGVEQNHRELTREVDGNELLIHDGPNTARWQVTEKLVTISSNQAREDATHIHNRTQVPLAWATPTDGRREESGRFWAFFPTETPSYIPGILNAPWKLNSDRQAIINGEWNSALMAEAAKLIVSVLPDLRNDNDPGRPLDAFPRNMTRHDEVAHPLIEAVWDHLSSARVVPDMNGRLHEARELWRHPTRDAEIVSEWQSIADTEHRETVIHPSCLLRQRESRLKSLVNHLKSPGATNEPCLQEMRADEWFSRIASTDVAKAMSILKLAARYEKEFRKAMWESVRPALRIILTSDGKLRTADECVLAPDGMLIPDGRFPVAHALAGNPECRQILQDVFSVRSLDDSVWNQVLKEKLPRGTEDNSLNRNWGNFWKLLRSAPQNVRENFAKMNIPRLRVRNRQFFWVRPDEVLFPGAVVRVGEEPISNERVLVDESEHGNDRNLLEILGVRTSPHGTTNPGNFASTTRDHQHLNKWLEHTINTYLTQLEGEKNPRTEYLEPLGFAMPRGWMLLAELSGAANARLSEIFIHTLQSGGIESRISFGHKTRLDAYPKMEIAHPMLWYLLRHGSWMIGNHTARLSSIAVRKDLAIMTHLALWGRLRGAVEILLTSEVQAPETETDRSDFWKAMFSELATMKNIAGDNLSDLWIGATAEGITPDSLPTKHGPQPLNAIFVTGSHDLALQARNIGQTVVTLDNESLELWLSRGAKNLARLIQPRWTESIGPVAPLVSVIPELSEFLRDEMREMAFCHPVSGLEILVESHSSSIPCLLWDRLLILDLDQLNSLSGADKFRRLLSELSAAGWLKTSPENALQLIGNARVDELRAYVAEAPTLAERLLRCVGGRTDPLLRALGGISCLDFVRDCSPEQLAELVLAQLGPVTLQNLKDELESVGLQPPARWRHPEAREFVTAIGFPEEFGESPEHRRDPEEIISGPINLPALHDFQEEVLQGIRQIMESDSNRRRAVVSLPTGGGKTRVTVEAAVRLVLKPEGCQRLVLWIAQTDELCEQAVQAFRQVWLNVGATDTDLRIIRLWGGNPNPPHQDPGKPVVVISSIQTLNIRLKNPQLAWLRKPGLCIVDECHHAITPSYTNLLRFLDAEAPRSRSQTVSELAYEPAFLGLSATPFRTDDEESKRLARRFDNLWFPENQAELHHRLRRQEVLAEIVSEELESGSSLTEDEQRTLDSFPYPWEGIKFDNILESINQRLGGNSERNERLVDRIRRAEEKSILVFANSVQHAEELAARLNCAGIPAAAVSGTTPKATRRYFLERFKRGSIHVLCNHSVLSTGFDAPKTDMVLISRAVFSPVRYMQMVGRGLRGPANGGKPACRIVTVMDNLGRFQQQHAFHYCQKYFLNSSPGKKASQKQPEQFRNLPQDTLPPKDNPETQTHQPQKRGNIFSFFFKK